MCQALNGQVKSDAQGVCILIRSRGGRGLPVTRMAHMISGCLIHHDESMGPAYFRIQVICQAAEVVHFFNVDLQHIIAFS